MRPTGLFDAVIPDRELTTSKRLRDRARAHSEDSRAEGRDPRWVLTENWLNRVIADCHALVVLYRKHHRTELSPMDSNSCAVLNEHAEQQWALIEELTDRVHAVGGVAVADPRHIAELTCVPRAPDDLESARGTVSRLLQAQDIALRRARAGASILGERGDQSSSELLGSRAVSIFAKQWRELLELVEVISPVGDR